VELELKNVHGEYASRLHAMEAAQCSEVEELRAQLSELKAAQLPVESLVETMAARMDDMNGESAKAVGALEEQLGLIRAEVAHAGSRSAHALEALASRLHAMEAAACSEAEELRAQLSELKAAQLDNAGLLGNLNMIRAHSVELNALEARSRNNCEPTPRHMSPIQYSKHNSSEEQSPSSSSRPSASLPISQIDGQSESKRFEIVTSCWLPGQATKVYVSPLRRNVRAAPQTEFEYE
jgi:ribosomal protein L29